MAVLASDVITRVREILVDKAVAKRWTDAELLRYLSDGQRTIAAMYPDQVTKVAIVPLVPGTYQTLPADAVSLLTIYRNFAGDGVTPGRAIRLIRREILDDQNPGWHTEGKQQVVYNYIYDPLDSMAYFVYPPSNGLGFVQMNYCFNPEEVTDLTDELPLAGIYQTPLVDYVLYKAHQKDSDFAAGQQRAVAHLQAFTLFMETRSKRDVETNPNQSLGPFNPNVSGAAR